RRVEDLRRQLDRPLGGVGGRRVQNVNGHGHAQASCTLALAAERTSTRPPLGPGTAPSISSRPRSASTLTTRRLCVVCRSAPIRPAIRRPLNTRAGVEQPPIEPWLRWAPCEDDTPAKPCRFITPAVPLPLVVPVTSTMSPSANTPGAVISAPI